MSIDLFTPDDRDVIAAHIGEMELTDEVLERFLASAIEQAPGRTPEEAVSAMMVNLRAALDVHIGDDGRARTFDDEMAKAVAEAELINAAVDILDARYRKAIPEPHNFPTDMNDKLIDWDQPPAEVLAEAFADEDYADLKGRLLIELGSLRNMLVGNIPMSAEEQSRKLTRLAALEHPTILNWLQG